MEVLGASQGLEDREGGGVRERESPKWVLVLGAVFYILSDRVQGRNRWENRREKNIYYEKESRLMCALGLHAHHLYTDYT